MVYQKVECCGQCCFYATSMTYTKQLCTLKFTSFLYPSHSLKNLNKTVNFDLSYLVQWVTANKISLNINKTEIVVFGSPTKKIYKDLNFKQ